MGKQLSRTLHLWTSFRKSTASSLRSAKPGSVTVSTCLGYARLASDSTTETAVDGVALLAVTCIFEKFRGTMDFMNPPHPTISSAYAVDMVTHSKIQKFVSAAILFPYPCFQTSSNVHNRNWYQDLEQRARLFYTCHCPVLLCSMCRCTTDTYDLIQSMCMLSRVCLFSITS